jgi:Heterokaryon incompatibility protein (HET)
MKTHVSFQCGWDPRMTSKHLALLKQGESRQSYGYAHSLDPEWISIADLRERLKQCLKCHGTICSHPQWAVGSFDISPSWLIDVKRMCIVSATSRMRYLALSYVWGQTTTLRLLRHNKNELQQDGALSRSVYSTYLARTVKETIQLVRLLGEEYLWVDSLCIVQDDPASLNQQINFMGAIYGNAYITIVAAQGENANSGLHGICGVSRSRRFEQQKYRIADGYELAELRTGINLKSLWRMRAWTYQEQLFSPRKIIFESDMVRWECARTWFEDRDSPVDWTGSLRSLENQRAEPYHSHLPWPNVFRYLFLVQQYNIRTLTYPEDNLRAFAGITTALNQSFVGGFICGLMELFFDVALLWRCGDTIERRNPSGTSDENSNPLPSWSWAGWKGRIDIGSWPTDHVKFNRDECAMATTCRVFQRVDWYCSESVRGSRRPILSSRVLKQYRSGSLDPQKSLPPGWSRHSQRVRSLSTLNVNRLDDLAYCRINYHSAFDRDNQVYFMHDSDKSTQFWYPVPIPDPEATASTRKPEPYLFCRTQRGLLFLAERLPAGGPPHAILRTENNGWAGVMSLNSPEEYPDAVFTSEGPLSEPTGCEIILISEGLAMNHSTHPPDESVHLPEWDHPERPKDTPLYEYINVLWIEWRSDVAYRKSVGRVLKRIWEDLELEWIDVTLG